MIFKRSFSLLLCMFMLLSMVPVAQATEKTVVEASSETPAVTGTNGVGTLLSRELQAYQQADEAAGGYNVVGLTVENGVATVQFRTLEAATLVVGIYTEDGLQLLASGKTKVQPEDTQVSVVIEGQVPAYFRAAAYLVDIYDFSPLCSAYETVMYTAQMQELLASTVDDYESDRVLNLDDSRETNFAVYEASTIVIEPQPGVNTVKVADHDNATYVIENADAQITALKAGDIFVLPYNSYDILIVKVSYISVTGTTATILGDYVELEEVFAYAKLEATGDAADALVDESTAEEGVVFDGVTQTPATRAFEGDGKTEYQFNFQFVNKELKNDSDYLSGKATFNGSLALRMDLSYSYYISMSTQFTELKFNMGVGTDFSVEGKGTGKIGLPDISIGVLGLRVEFQPELQLEFSAKMEYKSFATFTAGIYHSNETGTKDLTTTPEVTSDLKAEGSVFFGINLRPVAKVLEGLVITELDLPVGFELKVTPEIGPSEGEIIHSCKKCTAMELFFKTELEAKIKFLGSDKFVQKIKVTPVHVKVCDFYSSKDHDQSGTGKCPYKAFLIQVTTDAATDVYAGGALLGTTDENGMTAGYLSAGTYTFTAAQYARQIKVERPLKIVLDDRTDALYGIDPDDATDVGVLASGTFGLNHSWVLYHNGLMRISGQGTMPQWLYSSSTPWYKHKGSIKTVVLEEGLDDVGYNAFSGCSKLTKIVFPDSMTHIMDSAFSGCTALTEVTIGCGVTFIDSDAFWGCKKLQRVTLPEGLKTIGKYAFQNCSALQELTIPAAVTYIYDYAFDSCTALKSLHILHTEKGQLRIYNRAFQNCTGLTSLTFPHSIKNLGAYVFYGCTGVTEIYFEGSVMAIDNTAFSRVTATVYYPANNTSWNAYRNNYGGKLTWVAFDYAAVKKPATKAAFGGEYDTQGTLKTASFSQCVPGAEYLMIAMVDFNAQDALAPSNLLAVLQGQADENGELIFTYIQRISTPVSYVLACGPSGKSLADAQITFPYMQSNGMEQAAAPTVTYDGAVLLEGVDYVLVGSTSYNAAGTYTCYVRGIRAYTGFVECSYTVEAVEKFDIDVARMLLGNALEFQFGVDKTKIPDKTGYYAVIEKIGGDGVTKYFNIPANQWGTAGQYHAISYSGLRATEMADTFFVTIYNAQGQAVSNPKQDSVRDYVDRSGSGQNNKGRTMLADMLNYGAAAQLRFGYGTEDLANSKLTNAQKAYATKGIPEMSNKLVKGKNYQATRFLLESSIQVQLAFKGLTTDMYAIYEYTDFKGRAQTVRVEGADFVMIGGAPAGVELTNLVYADARSMVHVTVYNADGTVHGEATESMESCATRGNADVFIELMKFADSAKAYLA